MKIREPKRWIARATLGWCALTAAGSVTPRPAVAQGAAPRDAATGALDRAVQVTEQTGRTLVVGVTSNADPASRRLWKGLVGSGMARDLAATTQFVEVVAESQPADVERLGVKPPAFLIVRRVDGQIHLASLIANPTDAFAVADWLRGQAIGDPARAPVKDDNVARAGHNQGGTTASSQGIASPQTYAPPPSFSPPPPQPQAPQYMAAPMLAAPPIQPGIVVPTQSPPVYIQQQPPTIVVGSPGTANVVYTNTAPSLGSPMLGAPMQPSMPMLGNPAQPSTPALGGPAQPQPNLGTPTMVMPSLGVGVQAFQAGPALGAGNAANPQVVGLMLQRPGLLRRLLGALGREMANLGNPSIRMTSAPEFSQVPLTAAALGAMAPASQATLVQPAPAAVVQAPPVQPSPQGEAARKHHHFSHNN